MVASRRLRALVVAGGLSALLLGGGAAAEGAASSFSSPSSSSPLKDACSAAGAEGSEPCANARAQVLLQAKRATVAAVKTKGPKRMFPELSEGCPALCVKDDVGAVLELPGDGNETWPCRDIETYVLNLADPTDCVSLIDHFAPLCCQSQLNEVSINVTDCSQCDGSCIMQGACFHSYAGALTTESQCSQHQGTWCGQTVLLDATEEEADEEEDEEEGEGNLTRVSAIQQQVRGGPFITAVSGPCSNTYTSDAIWRDNYGDNEDCRFLVNELAVVQASYMHTERGYDYLTVGGIRYHGLLGEYDTPKLAEGVVVSAGSYIDWHSDSSVVKPGWKLTISRYSLVGPGVCPSGYYAGWESNNYRGFGDSAANCQAACDVETQCYYVSFSKYQSCSRYNSGAGECAITNSAADHVTYKKMVKTYPCCEFVHTRDRCRSGSVLMLAEPHNWLPYGWSDQRWGGTEGTTEVLWQCHARRRRCPFYGCGGTGHERTGFSPPSNAASVHYDNDAIDYYPMYCPPPSVEPELSPKERGCCSIADGTVDRCRSMNYIQIAVNGVWQRCYKNQICEFEFDTPQSQGVRMDWYCGDTKEGVRWGLYFDTLQVKFHCDGMVEWNPWWCGRATGSKAPPSVVTQFAGLIGLTTGGDFMNGQTQQLMSPAQVEQKVDDFIYQNKKSVCEGMSAAAVYDQLLKPSSVCWRAGMSARSSLFPHHSDYGTKTTLLEEGTRFERGERESSPFVATMERLRSNASLMQMAVSGNHTVEELFIDPFQLYCAISGGTDCAAIGKERCTCYCVEPGTCTSVMAAKYAKAAVAVLEMALDIVACVYTGGTATVAKAGAKAAAKAALKAAAKKAAASGGKALIQKAATAAAKNAVKNSAKKAMKGRLKRSVAQDFTKQWGEMTFKQKVKKITKEKMRGALTNALTKASCENLIGEVFDEGVSDPDWVNSPDFKWGDGNGPGGYLETIDITGITGLVGIFHEADCPAAVPGAEAGDSCPR